MLNVYPASQTLITLGAGGKAIMFVIGLMYCRSQKLFINCFIAKMAFRDK